MQQFPLAAGQVKVRPAPRLQTQPFKDVYLLKQGQNERLDSYGWVDKADGIVHIPIDRAIELTLERGLPAPGGWVGCDEHGGAGQFRRPNGGAEIEALC